MTRNQYFTLFYALFSLAALLFLFDPTLRTLILWMDRQEWFATIHMMLVTLTILAYGAINIFIMVISVEVIRDVWRQRINNQIKS